MKSAIVHAGPKVTIEDVPIPKPSPTQLLIKVIYSGSNPKDWKVPELGVFGLPRNEGNDIAGIVEAVGVDVTGFHSGDRVAAFLSIAGGGYAEYAVAEACTAFFLPAKTTFQEGAAIPLAALTAAIGLYANDRLNLPQPTAPAFEPIPLVVYGGSSAVGTYAIQLAKRSNIHPIIAIAGRAQDHVRGILDASKGDVFIDYRSGDDAVVQGIKEALQGQKLQYAYDATAEHNSWVNICKVLDHQTGRITLVLPPKDDMAGKHKDIPASIHQSGTLVADVHGPQIDLGYLYSRYFTKGLEEGWFKAQTQEECPGGLEGVEGALKRLKDGSASATKFVFKIADTPGAGSGT